MIRKLLLGCLTMGLTLAAVAQTPQSATISSNGPVVVDYGKHPEGGDPTTVKIAKEVRHELLLLPYYSLFDDLEFTVQGRTVTLSGSLTSQHAVTKADAEDAVKRIEGVEKVINNIQVLPPSPFDDQIRERTYLALSRAGSLSQYFWEAAPSIHILVDHQKVTLAGYVLNEADKNLAGITANGVSGVFKVTNDLRVVK